MTEMENRFSAHRLTDDQKVLCQQIRQQGRTLAEMIQAYCPPGRERSLALTKAEECVMWANKAIAMYTAPEPRPDPPAEWIGSGAETIRNNRDLLMEDEDD